MFKICADIYIYIYMKNALTQYWAQIISSAVNISLACYSPRIRTHIAVTRNFLVMTSNLAPVKM